MKTMQEYFNLMVAGLASQGFKQSARPTLDAEGKPLKDAQTCLFRGPDGLKCAVGHLISDEALAELNRPKATQYVPYPEPSTSSVIAAVMGVGVIDLYTQENGPTRSMIVNVQNVHDNGNSPENMKARLVRVAVLTKLTVPPELEGIKPFLYDGEKEENLGK